ncbi:MAG: outer membrane beta-barrel protein [Bryobacteraceae bacterium]|jgi:opacity protein-like surface antigen
MRPLFLLLFSAVSALAQPFSFGVKAGLPLTDFLNAAESQQFKFSTATNRYIVGPTAELHLPFGLGVEFDILYRRFDYNGNGTLASVVTSSSATGNAWEFPLLAKYRLPMKILHPYVDAGVSWDTLSGLTQTITNTVLPNHTTTTTTSNPAELKTNTARGFVMGAGLDVKVLRIHLSPEIRYTRWGAQHFIDPNGLLHSNQNQGEFLLGITF